MLLAGCRTSRVLESQTTGLVLPNVLTLKCFLDNRTDKNGLIRYLSHETIYHFYYYYYYHYFYCYYLIIYDIYYYHH